MRHLDPRDQSRRCKPLQASNMLIYSRDQSWKWLKMIGKLQLSARQQHVNLSEGCFPRAKVSCYICISKYQVCSPVSLTFSCWVLHSDTSSKNSACPHSSECSSQESSSVLMHSTHSPRHYWAFLPSSDR